MVLNPLAADLDHVLAHTDGLWDDLRGQRVFVTGGTGFFGCWLLESFCWANRTLELGTEMTVLTRRPEAFAQKAPHLASDPAVTLHTGDVTTFDFPSGEFSHVIHAATEADSRLIAEEPLAMLDTIVAGTRRTLDFAAACGARRFLLTSSGAVYGRQPLETTHVGEDYLGAPDPMGRAASYGEGKRLAEILCAIYGRSGTLEPVIARCFAFAGPYLPLGGAYAAGNFVRDALVGRSIEIGGDGTPRRSYLYASDLAIWLWTLLLRGQPCRPYNVGSEDDLSITELAAKIATLGGGLPVRIAKTPEPGRSPERYVPCTARAREELGLRARVPTDTALAKMMEWQRFYESK